MLGADTVVVVDEAVLGKPETDAEAIAMLTRLSGRAHDVLTGVALAWPGQARSAVVKPRVWFAPLDDDEIRWYVATGEPLDKAGAYAIQGLACRFVLRIEGSYSNVVGLAGGNGLATFERDRSGYRPLGSGRGLTRGAVWVDSCRTGRILCSEVPGVRLSNGTEQE